MSELIKGTIQISIHASAKEATPIRPIQGLLARGFQSTPPRRRRRLMRGSHTYDSRISIHASAKEATPAYQYFRRNKRISIHASAKEATQLQSRDFCASFNFNPRLREGGDPLPSCPVCSVDISIHASAKEATATMGTTVDKIGFQSTPPRRRRRHCRRTGNRTNLISIHASAKEATSPVGQSGTNFLYFNPRLREGGDV